MAGAEKWKYQSCCKITGVPPVLHAVESGLSERPKNYRRHAADKFKERGYARLGEDPVPMAGCQEPALTGAKSGGQATAPVRLLDPLCQRN